MGLQHAGCRAHESLISYRKSLPTFGNLLAIPVPTSASSVSDPTLRKPGRCKSRKLSVHTAAAAVETPAAPAAPAPATARAATVRRSTKETNVEVSINLDGNGVCTANTPVHFLNHMLDQLASHGLFNVMVEAEGDTWIDDHHTNEDIGLAVGTALSQALGDRKGIHRFGDFTAPLDEALVHVVLDLSGRPHLSFDLDIPTERIGTYDTQLVEHFFQSLANTSGMTLHIRQLAGSNSHHIVEATFKAFARALRKACEPDPRRAGQIASSKGVLTQA
ncbi:hypothetical protein WJX74_001739 [Apatococcus lobatus]|uniref:Imidazoleglycerol-phosphate dehydratase n=1 Tax=Apatococcus lobatus TaxID=904363 RepID=A0AAW1QD19_9CHLO